MPHYVYFILASYSHDTLLLKQRSGIEILGKGSRGAHQIRVKNKDILHNLPQKESKAIK